MDPRVIVPLPAASPWSVWARPDIHHCEANGAGWIAAPSDTWSNLAYLAVAAWLWSRREEPRARALALSALAIGVSSFLFHATYTFAFQVLDYGGMFLYSAWIVSLACARLGKGSRAILPALLEGGLYARRRGDYAVKPLLGCLGLVAAAFAFWNLDHADWFCRPDDHLAQGHALWHLLTAASFVPAFFYFRQF